MESCKTKVIYITSWFLLLMTLVIFPLSLNYLFKKLSLFENGGFNSFQWSLILLFALTTIIFFWWVIKRYVVPKSNAFSPLSLTIMLYSLGTLPAGLGLIVIVCLLISNFTILGIPSKSLLWIVILGFATISIYGLLEGNKLLNQISISLFQQIVKKEKKPYLIYPMILPFLPFFLIPWFLIGIGIAMNYQVMGKRKERNIAILFTIFSFFLIPVILKFFTLFFDYDTSIYMMNVSFGVFFGVFHARDYNLKKARRQEQKSCLKENGKDV